MGERVLSRQEGRMRKYSLYIYVQNSVLISFLNNFTMKNKLFCAAETNFFYVLIFEKGGGKSMNFISKFFYVFLFFICTFFEFHIICNLREFVGGGLLVVIFFKELYSRDEMFNQ